MTTRDIDTSRVRVLNEATGRTGKYVLYWMQQSQRAECNHALEYAVQRANDHGLPLVVAFGLMDGYPEANLRHYRFMLEGLKQTQQMLRERGILLIARHGHPADVALRLGEEASLIVCDRGYLRHQKHWRAQVAREAQCPVIQVEADVVVPVETASSKVEVAARTLRPKIHRCLDRYLVDLAPTDLRLPSVRLRLDGLDLGNIDDLLGKLKLDRSVTPVRHFRSGPLEANRLLETFLGERLAAYAENRNQPQTDYVSHMSKHLHFGQIAPLRIALAVKHAQRGSQQDRETLLEELIVRRELAHNFVHFTENYDDYDCLPAWARKTLEDHQADDRPVHYAPAQLEAAQTADPYWNAAMLEMKHTGYMHNHMRMYWGKKILEWSRQPREAYRLALRLNNKYFLDGRDANSFANVGWIFGLHDRPWPERPIYGKVRSMTASGLERKCDIQGYVDRVAALVAQDHD